MLTRKAWLLRPAQGLLEGQSPGCPVSHLLPRLEAPKHPVHRCPGLKTPAESRCPDVLPASGGVRGNHCLLTLPNTLWSPPWHGPRNPSTTIVTPTTLR